MQLQNVTRVYSGKLGCMCGCKGKWTADNERSKAIIFNKIMRNPAREYDEQAKCVYVETDTRIIAAYFD